MEEGRRGKKSRKEGGLSPSSKQETLCCPEQAKTSAQLKVPPRQTPIKYIYLCDNIF